jgi:hypothetical protein
MTRIEKIVGVAMELVLSDRYASRSLATIADLAVSLVELCEQRAQTDAQRAIYPGIDPWARREDPK